MSLTLTVPLIWDDLSDVAINQFADGMASGLALIAELASLDLGLDAASPLLGVGFPVEALRRWWIAATSNDRFLANSPFSLDFSNPCHSCGLLPRMILSLYQLSGVFNSWCTKFAPNGVR